MLISTYARGGYPKLQHDYAVGLGYPPLAKEDYRPPFETSLARLARKRGFRSSPPGHWNWHISLTYNGLPKPIRQEIRQKTSRGRPGFCRWRCQELGLGKPTRCMEMQPERDPYA